jgi:hypothetical protein
MPLKKYNYLATYPNRNNIYEMADKGFKRMIVRKLNEIQ